MNQVEAVAVLLVAGLGCALALWLWWSLVRGRRRVPPRSVVLLGSLEAPGVAIPVDGDPRHIYRPEAGFWRQIALEIEDALLTPQRKEARDRMIGVLDEDPPDFAGAFDATLKQHPPSPTPSPWAGARPWAHA